ncbi:hypothetical protein LZ31DRAFT_63922 [Colletotrichum somersetense]|nr:hypothetical protein LZ31DRAFT_63922 [Colletotrichum somersetense]
MSRLEGLLLAKVSKEVPAGQGLFAPWRRCSLLNGRRHARKRRLHRQRRRCGKRSGLANNPDCTRLFEGFGGSCTSTYQAQVLDILFSPYSRNATARRPSKARCQFTRLEMAVDYFHFDTLKR